MKLRHAAVLALVGWYLMMPPYRTWKEAGGLDDPPLSLWIQEGQFDTATECQQALERSFESIQ